MFDIIKHYKKVSPELVEKFSQFEESASIHESMGLLIIRSMWTH